MATEVLEELGPVDVVVIGYPAGAPMTGSAAQILLDEVEKGTISVLDALFVTKNDDGTYSGFDATGLEKGQVGNFQVFEVSALQRELVAMNQHKAIKPLWDQGVASASPTRSSRGTSC